MKNTQFALLLLCVFFVAMFITANVYYKFENERTFTIRASLEVANRTGFNVATEELYFSKVMPSISSRRSINLTAPKYPSTLFITAEGNLTPWLSSPENGISLEPYESREVLIIASVPPNATIGEHYEATVTVRFKRR